jgi:hypothetical protein
MSKARGTSLISRVASSAHHEVQHQVNYVRQMGTKNGRWSGMLLCSATSDLTSQVYLTFKLLLV